MENDRFFYRGAVYIMLYIMASISFTEIVTSICMLHHTTLAVIVGVTTILSIGLIVLFFVLEKVMLKCNWAILILLAFFVVCMIVQTIPVITPIEVALKKTYNTEFYVKYNNYAVFIRTITKILILGGASYYAYLKKYSNPN